MAILSHHELNDDAELDALGLLICNGRLVFFISDLRRSEGLPATEASSLHCQFDSGIEVCQL